MHQLVAPVKADGDVASAVGEQLAGEGNEGGGFGAAPVLDKTETLVGMLSAIDLLRALSDMIKEQKKTKKKK